MKLTSDPSKDLQRMQTKLREDNQKLKEYFIKNYIMDNNGNLKNNI